jgi:hypothetical protein
VSPLKASAGSPRFGIQFVAVVLLGAAACTSSSPKSVASARDITSQLAEKHIECNFTNWLPANPARAKDAALCQTPLPVPDGFTPSFFYRVSVFADPASMQTALRSIERDDSSWQLPCYLVGSNWVIEGQASADLAPMKEALGGEVQGHSTYMCPDRHSPN